MEEKVLLDEATLDNIAGGGVCKVVYEHEELHEGPSFGPGYNVTIYTHHGPMSPMFMREREFKQLRSWLEGEVKVEFVDGKKVKC